MSPLFYFSLGVLVVSYFAVVWHIYQVARENQQVGTALFPLFRWCSARHVFLLGLAALVNGLAVAGVVIGAPPPVGDFRVWYMTLLGIVAVLCLGVYLYVWLIWKRAEARWSPPVVTSTSTCHCTYCGTLVVPGRPLGGYCPVCGADPTSPCDPKRHQRHESTGTPNPPKKRR